MTVDECLEILHGLHLNADDRFMDSYVNGYKRMGYELALEDAIIKINQKRADEAR